MRNNKTKIYTLTIIIIILIISSICYYIKHSNVYETLQIRIAATDNYPEIKSFIEAYPSGREHDAALWLSENMIGQCSYDNIISRQYYKFTEKDTTIDYKLTWLRFNSICTNTPHLQNDIQTVKAEILIENMDEAVKTWKNSPWKGSISFDVFCKYILPYKIDKEPIVNWRKHYRDKYSHIINGIKDIKEAFRKVYQFEIKTFPVKNTYFPYAQDALLLDKLHGGNCKQRAFHMVYVMRALGIPATVDYTPVWSNYGSKGHYWVVLVNKDNTVTTYNDSIDQYIDGAYEKTKCYYNSNAFTSSIDSLKKISKIYRLTFWQSQNISSKDTLINFEYLKNSYTSDVTSEYKYTTKKNIIRTKSNANSKLYVCTYTQGEGWIPISKVKRVSADKIDIGGLLHDNIITISEYKDGAFLPISCPYLITHNKPPKPIIPNIKKKESIVLHRKYLLRSIWINRWAEIIGTRIETSPYKSFSKDTKMLHTFTNIPNCETLNVGFGKPLCDYIRILPQENIYPVFAEISLFDKNNNKINDKLFSFYAIGESLTGDTIVTRKLHDNNLKTTFYKRFPYWIGIDVRKIKKHISKLQMIMWNDENQIIKGHEYELFYYDKFKWNSLGIKTASTDKLLFHNVPTDALLLLKDYTKGQEERIFLYKNKKQIWY